jgi:hypothetical protein
MNEMDHENWLEQHDRMHADHARDIAEMNKTLRRAIRLGVEDARRQCKRNLEFDQKMTQIAAAQLVNEELLKAFLTRGGNGKH